MNNHTAQHLTRIACELARANIGNAQCHEIAHTIHEAHRLGKALRQRYENECSYEWACNNPAYRKRTASLERKLGKLLIDAGFIQTLKAPLGFTLESDPRGWPIILSIGGHEYRLGGEV